MCRINARPLYLLHLRALAWLHVDMLAEGRRSRKFSDRRALWVLPNAGYGLAFNMMIEVVPSTTVVTYCGVGEAQDYLDASNGASYLYLFP